MASTSPPVGGAVFFHASIHCCADFAFASASLATGAAGAGAFASAFGLSHGKEKVFFFFSALGAFMPEGVGATFFPAGCRGKEEGGVGKNDV